MDDFRINLLKLNLKESEPVKSILKLNKGDLLKGRVKEYSKGKATVIIKGREMEALAKRTLVEGEVIDLKVEEFKKDKIILKVIDKSNNLPKEVKGEGGQTLKQEILSNIRTSKTVLTNEKVENVAKNLKKVLESGEFKKDTSIKTLVFIEQKGMKFNMEVFKNIYSYFKNGLEDKINLEDKNLKDKLKEAVKKLKSEKGKSAKGAKLINSLNKQEGNGLIELLLGIEGEDSPLELRVKYDLKDENQEFDKKSYVINMNLKLKELGEVDIMVNSWNRSLGIEFSIENRGKIKELKSVSGELKKSLIGMGYIVDSILVKEMESRDAKINESVDIKI